ncbi:sugar MFS transporter [Pseudomonas sp. CBSPBW29]|uniref:sugar MFS transporter n=1 Tax=Pseudomonas TaxID=286 RepID=UPI0021AC163E|nr:MULTISPECIES: sugar MFS transporter [unclassified Pseudomonas]WEL42616.1 sugar MFS transporter [Pseudomonas sp. CBSPBW29]WEL63690.1 sugar MFS transporter [Pseudomonas sp. CBSPGW29]WEL72876.1 sugar MFS transporter [Pseudomonas sp. CBSPCGW29]WEL74187.1 sugar MFS transporter [Pseudomonas sp. CBSPAW29]WEL81576.1 sugar MFS transporter [Pseudomonas sp. CBSPCAW29]WEL90066.1 sugar MFS transporter [Pseudomonas sp. CBSPCBW29]
MLSKDTHLPGTRAVPTYRWALMLVTSLFFLWGLSYGLLDVLNKHFQEVLHVSKAQSGLLQGAYFGAYFLIALPAGLLMDRHGYKAGILLGLCLYAAGALLFMPAAAAASFPFFLFALFVIACGLGCLETAANPYATVLGEPQGAERRLNLAQSFNGLGQFFGPLIGGAMFFSAGSTPASDMNSLQTTYVVIAVLVLLVALLIARTPLPDLRAQEQALQPVAGKGLWQYPEFVGGVITQFFYVAAQVGVGAFFINYVTEHWAQMGSQQAAYLLSIAMLAFMFGRFFSTWLMGRVSAQKLLLMYALINIALCALVVIGVEGLSVIALIAVFFFMSIMFPTLFAMGVKNLGPHTKRGSSFMIMAIVGGALMPYLMGKVADNSTVALAYLLPMGCFVIVAVYARSRLRHP